LAVLIAFALLELVDDDWRPRPLEDRKAKLVRRAASGIHFTH